MFWPKHKADDHGHETPGCATQAIGRSVRVASDTLPFQHHVARHRNTYSKLQYLRGRLEILRISHRLDVELKTKEHNRHIFNTTR